MELVLSEYIKLIKNAWNERVSDEFLLNLLFAGVIENYGLKKDGEPYAPLLNQSKVDDAIKANSYRAQREYFNKFIHSSLCSSDISDIDGIHE